MNELKNDKQILKYIFVVIIIIGILIVILCVVRRNKEKQSLIDEGEQFADERIDYNNVQKEQVIGNMTFFSITDCIQRYLDTANVNNFVYYGKDENDNYTKLVNDKEIQQRIYSLLSNKYISDNRITVDNVFNYVDKAEERLLFVPLEMQVLRGQKSNKYLVSGFVVDLDYYKKKDMYIFVNEDEINETFSIELINTEYNDINQISMENENQEIEENSNNKYERPKVTEAYMAQQYFNIYKRIMLGDTELAYEYLNEEYKNKRFGNYEQFEKYVNNNRESIRFAGISKYTVNNSSEGTEYICLDSKGNYCIFREKGAREYEVFLDTYTIESDKFKTEYNNGSEQKKVQLNIDKFMKMINNKDYSHAYEVLDDEFKNNYFKTEETFEKYIKNNFFEYNSVTYDKFSQEGEIYIYKITISDKTLKNDNKKSVNIIMQLKEGTDFIMSFGKAN